jgi:predicted Zn-dependent protease
MNKITIPNYIIFLLFTALLIVLPVQAELDLSLPDYNLPDIGDASIASISYAKERAIGLNVLRKIRATAPVIEDPEISAWIRSLGNRLSACASGANNPFYFLVLKDSAVNAFATLGGVVVVNTGLILQTDSEDELAAVIAHEIAHVSQRHIARMLENSRYNMLGTGVAILAGILASSKNAEAGQAIITGAVAMQAHKDLTFSRVAEAEADRVGLRILATAGFNPAAMPVFLKKLEAEFSDARGAANEYLRSHPLAVTRVSDARSAVAKYARFKQKIKQKNSNQTYQYMREKIRVLSRARGKYAHLPQNISANVRRYAKASALLQRGNINAALKITGIKSSNKSEALLIANALLQKRKYQKVVQLLKPLVRLYPGENALIIPLANAYMGLGQAQQAWQLINHVILSEQSSLIFFEVRQRVAKQLGLIGSAYRSVAERNMRIGEYKHATTQALQAMKSTDISAAELQSLQYLLHQVKTAEKSKNKDF